MVSDCKRTSGWTGDSWSRSLCRVEIRSSWRLTVAAKLHGLAFEDVDYEDEERVRWDCLPDASFAITKMRRHRYSSNAAHAHTDDAVLQTGDDAPLADLERNLDASFHRVTTAQEEIVTDPNSIAPEDLVAVADIDFFNRDAALFHERPNESRRHRLRRCMKPERQRGVHQLQRRVGRRSGMLCFDHSGFLFSAAA